MLELTHQIKDSIAVSQVVGRNVTLKQCRTGEMIGLCPFHQEKSPSFTVSDRKGFYHCFGCGAHGDVISFVKEIYHLHYMEAVEKLANEIGLKLPNQDQKFDNKTKIYHQILDETAKFYSRILSENLGFNARTYLEKRGVSKDLISAYRIGYAPEGKLLENALTTKNFAQEDIIKLGILKQGPRSLYDPMHGRIIFPIANISGTIVGFGGRKIHEDQSGPKYLNSSETVLFHKGDILWGLNHADRFCRQNKVYDIIIVEGYMDAMALAGAGYGNIVAPMGTNLKANHIERIWKLSYNPILCLDNDQAGKKATIRLIMEILPNISANKNIKILDLGMHKDPDEYISSNGKESWAQVLYNATNLSDYIFDLIFEEIGGLNSPEHKSKFRDVIDDYAKKIQDHHLKYEYKKYWLDQLWQKSQNRHSNQYNKTKLKIPLYTHDEEEYAVIILSAIIAYPELEELYDLAEIFGDFRFQNDKLNHILNYILEKSDHQTSNFFDISLFSMLHKYDSLDVAKQKLENAMTIHQINLVKDQISVLAKKITADPNEENVARLQHLQNYVQQLYTRLYDSN